MQYFLDTNIISRLMRQDTQCLARRDELIADADMEGMYIPLLAYYEIRRGLVYANATSKQALFNSLLHKFPIVGITMRTCDIAAKVYAQLRQKGILIEDADIFIASSAMEAGATLVTSNAKHMQRIEGLVVEAWV